MKGFIGFGLIPSSVFPGLARPAASGPSAPRSPGAASSLSVHLLLLWLVSPLEKCQVSSNAEMRMDCFGKEPLLRNLQRNLSSRVGGLERRR